MDVVNLEDKFGRIGEHWSPKILAQLNDYHVKAVKLQGEFVWHKHDETDELFLVTKGSLVIRFATGMSRSARGSSWSCRRASNTCRSPRRSARCC